MDNTKNKHAEISPEDAMFLKQLGFTQDELDEEDPENDWVTFCMEIKDHAFIDGLYISVNLDPGFIGVYNGGGWEPFIKKPFTRQNLFHIMNFLGIQTLTIK